jgi:CheY-like chemotaxis protein
VNASDLVGALADLAWPILIGLVVWRLLPTLRNIAESRGFTIKAGGAEITVQQASDQLLSGVEDLREQVSALKLQVGAMEGSGTTEDSPIATGVPQLRRILWVDDYPDNNAFEVAGLERKGVSVELARSTAEAMRVVGRAAHPFDAIITDMGREENGQDRPAAGIELIERLKAENVPSPVIVYASARAISRLRPQLVELGVDGTSSATELLEKLGRLKPM